MAVTETIETEKTVRLALCCAQVAIHMGTSTEPGAGASTAIVISIGRATSGKGYAVQLTTIDGDGVLAAGNSEEDPLLKNVCELLGELGAKGFSMFASEKLRDQAAKPTDALTPKAHA